MESNEGFTYSIELLVKCHRLGWKMAELPAKWYERTSGKSRFQSFFMGACLFTLVQVCF